MGQGKGVEEALELWLSVPVRCRTNMAHIRQSRPDYGLGFQARVLEPFRVVASSLGSEWPLD